MGRVRSAALLEDAAALDEPERLVYFYCNGGTLLKKIGEENSPGATRRFGPEIGFATSNSRVAR